MKEMNLKDMETVSGGFNVKRILDSFSMKDVFSVLFSDRSDRPWS